MDRRCSLPPKPAASPLFVLPLRALRGQLIALHQDYFRNCMYSQLLAITGPTNFQAYVSNTDPMGLININQTAVLTASSVSPVWVSDPLPPTWWPATPVQSPINVKLLVNGQWQLAPGTIDYDVFGVLTITSSVAPDIGQYVGWDAVQFAY